MNLEQSLEEYLQRTCGAPQVLKNVISTLRHDLYFGPVYTDGHGGEATWGDEGATQFDFSRGCRIASDWISENVPSELWWDYDADCWMTKEPEGFYEDENDEESWVEPFWETIYHVDRNQILGVFVGKELARYVN